MEYGAQVTGPGDEAPPLAVTVDDKGDAATVRVSGELDMDNADMLAAALDRAFAPGSRTVVLDLAGLAFLDSTGVRVLLNGLDRAERTGSTLVVHEPRPLVERVLRISGIADHLGLPPRP
jgi:anti-sigma B factor antagonist